MTEKDKKLDLDKKFEDLEKLTSLDVDSNSSSSSRSKTLDSESVPADHVTTIEEKVIISKAALELLLDIATTKAIDKEHMKKITNAFLHAERSNKSKNVKVKSTGQDPSYSDTLRELRESLSECINLQIVKNVLPDFHTENPDSWFKIVEEIFNEYKIKSDRTKLNLIISKLDARKLELIENEMTKYTCMKDKYERVKSKLLSEFTQAAKEQVTVWLEGMSLNYRRPSDLLAEMNRLANGIVDTKLIRMTWVKKLSDKTQKTLESFMDVVTVDNDKLAEVADRVELQLPTLWPSM